MPFLQRHGCHIDFSKSVMIMGHKELTCVDKLGRPLAGGMQVVRSCTIPGHSRATVHCKVDDVYSSGLGVMESTHGGIRLAHSLNRLTRRGEIWVQYINPFPESVNLPLARHWTNSILSKRRTAGRRRKPRRKALNSARLQGKELPHTTLRCVTDTGPRV